MFFYIEQRPNAAALSSARFHHIQGGQHFGFEAKVALNRLLGEIRPDLLNFVNVSYGVNLHNLLSKAIGLLRKSNSSALTPKTTQISTNYLL